MQKFDTVIMLFFAALIGVVILYELLSGELVTYRWGGWVYTREKEPTLYWVEVLFKVAALLAILGHVAYRYYWG